MMALAGAMLVTSCSTDELGSEGILDNEAQISFNLGVDNALLTRAISDGTSVNKLVYRVLDKDGNVISGFSQVAKAATFPLQETLTLAKGQSYKIAFWAQNANGAYTVSEDMKQVTANYANAANNNENSDAFYKTIDLKVTGNAAMSVELTRPLAQINVGVPAADWDAAVKSGVTVAQSKAEIKSVPNQLNLIDGTVSGSADVTYNLAAIPAENLQADLDGNGEKESYKYLSMGYFLAGAEKATLTSAAFEFKPEAGESIVLNEGLNNIPVQRNYRTNIIGNILSSDINLNISVDPIYADDHNTTVAVADADALKAALTEGKDVMLSANVDLGTDQLNLSGADKAVTIDLNGKTLSGTKGSYADLVVVADGASVKFMNGSIVARENTSTMHQGLKANNGGAITLEGVKMDGFGYSVTALKDAKITVKNSVINSIWLGVSTNATVKDGEPAFSNPTITLENSEFYGEAPIMFNVPGTLTLNNVKAAGLWQGLIVRGGTAVVTDSEISQIYKVGENDCDKAPAEAAQLYLTSTWRDGNNLPLAALIMGNRGDGAYNYPTNVTLNNTKIIATDTTFPAIYAYESTANKVTFTADAVSTITGNQYKNGAVWGE